MWLELLNRTSENIFPQLFDLTKKMDGTVLILVTRTDQETMAVLLLLTIIMITVVATYS
jgi:hypothetical protein